MKDYSQQASFHRAALLVGLTSGHNVLTWADDIIMNDPDVPAGFVELSLIPAEDLSELRHALQPLAARGESPLVVRALFDRARHDLFTGVRNAKDTVTVVAQARRFLTLPPELSAEIDTLQDDHMLATAGVVGDIRLVEARVRDWLQHFAGSESAFQKEHP